jgi:phosphoesterase RecJ-like protein
LAQQLLGKGAKAILVLREEDGKVKGSFRSTQEGVDVAEMAKAYGGGGHKKAAGFTVPGKLVQQDGGWRVTRLEQGENQTIK